MCIIYKHPLPPPVTPCTSNIYNNPNHLSPRDFISSWVFLQDQQEATKKSADQKREADRKRKKAELELVKEGKRPFYLKKCELHLAMYYDQDKLLEIKILISPNRRENYA